MIVLGVDPGSQRCGYAVLDGATRKPKILEAGVIRPKSKALAGKLFEIVGDVGALVTEHRVEVIAMETAFVGEFPRAVIVLAHVRGALIGLIPALRESTQRTVDIVEPTPQQVKYLVTGKQNSSKALMQQAIQWHFGLSKPPEPPDVADALGIALWGLTIGATV